MDINDPLIGYIHIQVKEYWYQYTFLSPDGVKWDIPSRFVAKDKHGEAILIVTVPYRTGVQGHGMGPEDTIKFTATRIDTKTGAVINEDARIKEEGFYVRDNRGSMIA